MKSSRVCVVRWGLNPKCSCSSGAAKTLTRGERGISDDEGMATSTAWHRAKELLARQIEFARASLHDSRPTQAYPRGSVTGIQWTLGNYGPPCGGVPADKQQTAVLRTIGVTPAV